MLRKRLSNNTVLQLTLGVHFALLMLFATVNRALFDNPFVIDHQVLIGNLQLACYGGFALAQICLVGTWAAFSNASAVLRCGMLLLFLPLLAAAHAQVFANATAILWWEPEGWQEPRRTLIWIANYCLFTWMLALGAFFVRSLGCEIVWRDAPRVVPANAFQFRLHSLFAWLLLTCLVLGIGQLPFLRFSFVDVLVAIRSQWHVPDVMVGKHLALSIALCFAVLAFRSWKWIGCVLLFLPLVLGILDVLWLKTFLYGAGTDASAVNTGMPRDFVGLLYYVFVVTFAGTLMVVRRRGLQMKVQTPWWIDLFRRDAGPPPPVAEST